jgi:hypothetical protein
MKAIKKAIIGSIGKAVNPLFSGSTPPPASGALWDYSIAGPTGLGYSLVDASGFGTKTASGVAASDFSTLPSAAINYAVQVGSYFQVTIDLENTIAGVVLRPNIPSSTSTSPTVPQSLQVSNQSGVISVGDDSGEKYNTTPPVSSAYTFGIEVLSDSVVFHDLLNSTSAVATSATMGPLSISFFAANVTGASASATFDDDPALPSTVQAGTVTMANQSIQDLVEDANYITIEERYFRLNEGTTDYISIPSISVNSNEGYELEVDFFSNATTGIKMIASGSNGYYIYLNADDKSIRIGNRTTAQNSYNNNEFNTLKIVGDQATTGAIIYINGIQVLANSISPDLNIDRIGAYSADGYNFSGSIANLSISIDDVDKRFYVIDDNNDSIIDTVSTQDGTVINGNSTDWGEFTKSGNTWTGKNLTVPPWESTNQQIPIA